MILLPLRFFDPQKPRFKTEFWTSVGRQLWGEPLSWHSFFGHSFRFRDSVLASPSRRRGLGKGTAFESPSPAVLWKSFCCSLCSQKTPSSRFEIRPGIRSFARILLGIDSPAPSATAADCNTVR